MNKIIFLIFFLLLTHNSFSQRFNLNIGYKNQIIRLEDTRTISFQGFSAEYTYFPLKPVGLFISYTFYSPSTYYGFVKAWNGVDDLMIPVYIYGSGFEFSTGIKAMIYSDESASTFIYLTGSTFSLSHKGSYNKAPFYRNFDLSGDDVSNSLYGVSYGIGVKKFLFNIPFFLEIRNTHSSDTEYTGLYSVQKMLTRANFSVGIALPVIRPHQVKMIKIEY